MKRFENKVALVTGGANGLGENLVRRLVDEGAQVAVVDIEADTLKKLCDTLPGKTFGVVCDVRHKADVVEMVRKVIEHFGRIDILFNNAGLVRFTPFIDYSEEDWNMVIDTNLNGCFFVGQAVAKEMVRLGTKGVIVNTSSSCSIRTSRNAAGYAASKGGVAMLTKLMALDLAQYGIRVVAAAPGSAMTRITEKTRNDTEKYKMFQGKFAVGRFGKVEEITSVMLFLASDDASYMYGDNCLVDSGFTTH